MNYYRVYINGSVDVEAEDVEEAEEIAAENVGGDFDYFHIDEVTLMEENTEEEE